MSLLDILPEISLPAVLQRLLPPNAVRHLQPMIALTTSAVTVYLLTAVALYTLLWPKVLFFHPKYLPRSRLRTVPQVYTELIDSLANIIMVAIMSYPILYAQRGHFVPTDVSVPSSTNVQLAAAVWFACDIVGYIVHRILHSNSILFEYLHKNAHQWPVPTPFGLFSSSPLDIFVRVVLPPLLVPFFVKSHLQTYTLALLVAYAVGVLSPELSQASAGPLSSLVHTRPARFLHALSPSPSQLKTETRPEINPFTLATSGSTPPPSIEPPSWAANLATLTTIPDHVFSSYVFTTQDPVSHAEFSAKAWRNSKEALGTKARKTQRAGWGKVDRWANDGVGKLQTVSTISLNNQNNNENEGDVDGLLG